MINPAWLRSYCKLVEERHFTQTAQKLNMTQSGVSQHLKHLESYFNTSLLVREGKNFKLTQAGQSLYENAKPILQALINLKQQVVLDSPFSGNIRIMCPGSIGLKLHKHLMNLQVKHTALKIDCRFADNAGIEHALLDQNIDVGLMTKVSTHSDIASEHFACEQLLLVIPAKTKNASWETLMLLGFIDHPDGSHHANLLLSANFPQFRHINRFSINGFSNQISLILEPVSKGLGFTVLPSFAVDAFHKPEKLKIVPLKTEVAEPIYLAMRKNNAPAKRILTVINEIKLRLKD